MKVKIITPQEKLFDDEAKEVILPGEDGEFSVWDFHQPCLYSLRPGQVKVRLGKEKDIQQEKRFPVTRGIAKVVSNELMILVETS